MSQEIIDNIRESYPHVNFPNVYTSPAFYGRREKTMVGDRFAVVGEVKEDEKMEEVFYAFVSGDYKIIPHEEVIAKTQEMVEKLPEYGQPEFSIHMINQGAKMNCLVTFPEVEWEVKPGDPISPRISVKNSYDTNWELSIDFGALQKVCTNGLVAFRSLFKKSGRHKVSLDVDNMMHTLNEGMENYSKQIGMWQNWAVKELATAQYQQIWDELPFGETYRKDLEVLPQVGTGKTIKGMLTEGRVNAWDFHSIVTQFLTHRVESEMVQIEKGERVEHVFGKYLN